MFSKLDGLTPFLAPLLPAPRRQTPRCSARSSRECKPGRRHDVSPARGHGRVRPRRRV